VDRKTFDGSMTRLMGFYKLPILPAEKAHFTTYMDSLYEAVSRMDPFLFDNVTKELTKSLSRGQRPVPSQFYAVYEKLRDQQPKSLEKCESCASTGWVSVWLMNHETTETERFQKPCPKCRPRHAFKDAPQRPGWVEMEGAPEEKPTEATKNFLHDFFGIEAKTPQEALDKVTVMYREGKVKASDLVTVLKRQSDRTPKPVDPIKRMADLVMPVVVDANKARDAAHSVPPEEYEVDDE
jgi:hypothetical protein